MLEAVLPFLARVFGLGHEAIEFVGFQLDTTGVVAGVFVIAGIEGLGGFGVFLGQCMAFQIALAARLVRIELPDARHFGRRIKALLPFGKLLAGGGDELGNFRVANVFQRLAAELALGE